MLRTFLFLDYPLLEGIGEAQGDSTQTIGKYAVGVGAKAEIERALILRGDRVATFRGIGTLDAAEGQVEVEHTDIGLQGDVLVQLIQEHGNGTESEVKVALSGSGHLRRPVGYGTGGNTYVCFCGNGEVTEGQHRVTEIRLNAEAERAVVGAGRTELETDTATDAHIVIDLVTQVGKDAHSGVSGCDGRIHVFVGIAGRVNAQLTTRKKLCRHAYAECKAQKGNEKSFFHDTL